MRYALVYQVGIANVFRLSGKGRELVVQHDYRYCEAFCAGLLCADFAVEVYHADVAGDCSFADWQPGKGELWADKKHPPKNAA